METLEYFYRLTYYRLVQYSFVTSQHTATSTTEHANDLLYLQLRTVGAQFC